MENFSKGGGEGKGLHMLRAKLFFRSSDFFKKPDISEIGTAFPQIPSAFVKIRYSIG